MQLLFSQRHFHASALVGALKNHALYPSINWDRIEAGEYAVVDPGNPGALLYLSEKDYIVMIRVMLTSNRTMKLIAGPGDPRPLDNSTTTDQSLNSQNSPPRVTDELFGHFQTIAVFGNQRGGTKAAARRLGNLFNSLLSRFRHKEPGPKDSKGNNTWTETSMIKLSKGNLLQWFLTWHDQVSWWSRGSECSTVAKAERAAFGHSLVNIFVHNGINQLIMRLKISLFVVNSFLGGTVLKSTQSLGMRIRLINGLPALLPTYVRHGIRTGNRHYIHVWTTMLFSYKGILGTWMEPFLDSSSITHIHPTYQGNDAFTSLQEFVSLFWDHIKLHPAYRPANFKISNLFFTAHAGPNHSNSVLGSGVDAALWSSHNKEDLKYNSDLFAFLREASGVPRNLIREWLEATDQLDILKEFRLAGKAAMLYHTLAFNELERVYKSHPIHPSVHHSRARMLYKNMRNGVLSWFGENWVDTKPLCKLTLQRLQTLYEAAGKVRVIAIVDYWTNAVLKPVHDWIFSILRVLPSDATFDQEGIVRNFATRGYKEVYSYDLKNATDLIPLALYRLLFSWVFPQRIVDLWLDLLVNREFVIPASTMRAYPDHPERVAYNCGQPMGALTSWASMALVHHCLVLFAAYDSGVTDKSNILSFDEYMVLGDDVVIANKTVAIAYKDICVALGIPISIAKSYISGNGMFNFANQTFVGNNNWSPLSLREEVQISSVVSRAEMASRALRRGWSLKIAETGWLTPLVKLFLGPSLWGKVQPQLRGRRVHPIISWILSVLMQPGSGRFAFLGSGSVSIDAFLGAMLRKGELWTNPISNLGSLVRTDRTERLRLSIAHKWARQVYNEYLKMRERLTHFDTWLVATTSVDLEFVLKRIFSEQKTQAIERWNARFRHALKSVVITTELSNFGIHDVELGTGYTWESLTDLISEAEAELPRVPDFQDPSVHQLSGGVTGNALHSASEQTRALAQFNRLTNVLGCIDHLQSFVTPGIQLPGSSKDVHSPYI
jgi:hypothetical protein